MTAATRPYSRLAIPRTRGAITGLCLIVLGVWGAIVPFIGPYFSYAYINHQKWHFTYGRLWLDILPGVAALLAGLILLGARNRLTAAFAGWLGAAGGAWFVVGPLVSRFWNHGVPQSGRPLGGYVLRTFEQLGYFEALGAAIILLAAFAIGRVSVAAARDVLAAGSGRSTFLRGRPTGAAAPVATERPASAGRPAEPSPGAGAPSRGGDVPA